MLQKLWKDYLRPENSAHIVSSGHNAQLIEDTDQVNAFSVTAFSSLTLRAAPNAAACGTYCIKGQQQRRQLMMGLACLADSILGKRLGV